MLCDLFLEKVVGCHFQQTPAREPNDEKNLAVHWATTSLLLISASRCDVVRSPRFHWRILSLFFERRDFTDISYVKIQHSNCVCDFNYKFLNNPLIGILSERTKMKLYHGKELHKDVIFWFLENNISSSYNITLSENI